MFTISENQAFQALRCETSGLSPFAADLLEKDFVISEVLEFIASIKIASGSIQFGGGTSLVKAWDMPNRLSEDIDLKYAADPNLSRNRQNATLKDYRDRLEAGLVSMGFVVLDRIGEVAPSKFFSVIVSYESRFQRLATVESLVRVECKREDILLAPQLRNIVTLAETFLQLEGTGPELLCTRPEEIASQKLWIVLGDIQNFVYHPRDVRHLFDLEQLSRHGLVIEDFLHAFAQVNSDRGQRSFRPEFWAAANSDEIRAVFMDELSDLTPERLSYEDVLTSLEYFEALL